MHLGSLSRLSPGHPGLHVAGAGPDIDWPAVGLLGFLGH